MTVARRVLMIKVMGQANAVRLTLTFNPLRAVVMSYSYAKVHGQRSVSSEDRVETNGRTDRRTDGGDCITCHINAVGN